MVRGESGAPAAPLGHTTTADVAVDRLRIDGVDAAIDRAIEGRAVDPISPGQVDAAHIRHRGHLIPEPLHHLETGPAQAAGEGRRRQLGIVQSAVEHDPGMFQARHRILFHTGGGLPDDDDEPKEHGQQTGQQGTEQPDIELTHLQTSKWHNGPHEHGEKALEFTRWRPFGKPE